MLRNDVFNVNTIIKTKKAKFFENVFPIKYSIRKTLSEHASKPSSSQNIRFELKRIKRDIKETNFGDFFFHLCNQWRSFNI